MKSVVVSAVSLAALAVFAAPAAAQEVDVRHAVARVVVIVEDRADIGVEIERGRAGLPAPQVTRRGRNVRIDGDLGRDAIRRCSGGRPGGQPGEGASVEVREIGRVDLMDAPLIVLRTPRDVEVSVGGAVFGAIGRGARDIEFANGGCGSWTVANASGQMSLSVGGSGSIHAGRSRELDVALGGSGSVMTAGTQDMKVSLGGSGSVTVARVDGPLEVANGGSGDVIVREGRSPSADIAIGGSGNVRIGGTVGDLSAAIAGSGDIQVEAATGNVSRAVVGSGRVMIGS